jgi:hypothetical protein
MSIIHHPAWWDLRPYIRIQRGIGHDRIEVDMPESSTLLRRFLSIKMPCVCCGRSINPVRARAGQGNLYLSSTCEQDVSFCCSRSIDAREESDAIQAAIAGYIRPRQPALWD